MHSTLPSSLARFMQPSRATSKNGLFIALGTMTKWYFVWARAGLAIIAIAMPAKRIFLIGLLHAFYAYPENVLLREVDRRDFVGLPASIPQFMRERTRST